MTVDMVLDTSAIVALLLAEPGFKGLMMKIQTARILAVGSPTIVEAGMVLSSRLRRDARPELSEFLREAEVHVVPFGEDHWNTALSAFLRFGKGRHPAALNFGDCLAYAAAAVASLPLLCMGDDFPRTDIPLA
ncbi:MAG: PilT protein domain protein [Bryobacterales bacterium]|nr:PilT protein domain protein [Bryobacterales bacterium]